MDNDLHIFIISPHSFCNNIPKDTHWCDWRSGDVADKLNDKFNKITDVKVHVHLIKSDTPRSKTFDYNRINSRDSKWRKDLTTLITTSVGYKYILEIHSFPETDDGVSVDNPFFYILPVENRIDDAVKMFKYLETNLKEYPIKKKEENKKKIYILVKDVQEVQEVQDTIDLSSLWSLIDKLLKPPQKERKPVVIMCASTPSMCIYLGSDENDLQYQFQFQKYPKLQHTLLEFNENLEVLSEDKLDDLLTNITNFVIEDYKIV